MYSVQVQYFVTVLMAVEALLVILSSFAAATLCGTLSGNVVNSRQLLGVTAYMVFLLNFFLLKLGLYAERRLPSYAHSAARVATAVVLAFSVLGVTLYSLDIPGIPRLFLLTFALLLMLLLCLERALLDYILEQGFTQRLHSRHILIVGSSRRADLLAKLLARQRSWGHQIVGFLTPRPDAQAVVYGLPLLGSLEDLGNILMERVVDEVFFVLSDYSQDIRGHLETCEQQGVTYRIVPALYDPAAPHRLMSDVIQGIPTLSKVMVPFNPSGYIYKRIMDYAGGMVGSLLVLLMYPLAALAIKLDSPGPVFFTQPRVGRHGRIFFIYKFRTMYVDAEKRKAELLARNEMEGAIFKLHDDPRVTRVGRFLRRTSLDEFPQFLNVLQGEMSLVGPRPHPVGEVESYRPEHRRRLSVRPGLTGLWQISGRSNVKDFEQTVDLDLAYIDNWRFRDDIVIILRTVLVVLRGDGAV